MEQLPPKAEDQHPKRLFLDFRCWCRNNEQHDWSPGLICVESNYTPSDYEREPPEFEYRVERTLRRFIGRLSGMKRNDPQ